MQSTMYWRQGQDWLGSFAEWFEPDYLRSWLDWAVPTMVGTVVFVLIVVSLGRASGWFAASVPSGGGRLRRAWRWIARALLCVAIVWIAAPSAYLLYRLCTPPELPAAHIPADNGFDDFVAAGKLVDFSDLQTFDLAQLSDDKIEELATRCQPVLDRMEVGLAKSSWVTCVYVSDEELAPIHASIERCLMAWNVRQESLRRADQHVELAHACVRILRFLHESNRGHRADGDVVQWYEESIVDGLERCIGALSAQECRRLLAELEAIDRNREPLEAKIKRQRAYAYRADWQTHMEAVLAEQSSEDYQSEYETDLRLDKYLIARLHVAMAELALQAYVHDHDRLPDSLTELVPEYLAQVPVDALGDGPLKYRREGDAYFAWSVGWDGEDNGGRYELRDGRVYGDFYAIGPHMPPLPRAVRDALVSAWPRTCDWLDAAAAAAWEAALPTAD
jgi:hypothetical protein